MQVDPLKLTLKAPGTERLKLKYDELLSILLQFCFQLQLVPLHRGDSARADPGQGRHGDRRGKACFLCTLRGSDRLGTFTMVALVARYRGLVSVIRSSLILSYQPFSADLKPFRRGNHSDVETMVSILALLLGVLHA